MRIYRDYRTVADDARGAVVAIGNFDGVHRGHQAVINQALACAKQRNTKAAILTFEPHPRKFFDSSGQVVRLLTFQQKAHFLQNAGIDIVFAQRFNACFSLLSAEQFMRDVLAQGLGAIHVITGEDFRFGHHRGGTSQMLATFAETSHAFTYEAVKPIGEEGYKFSSSLIREYIKQGDMPKAAEALGRPYQWTGCVIHGDKRGRTIGFATANIRPAPVLMPRFGVYAVRVRIKGQDGWLPAVANLGVRPTFNTQHPLLEVHLLDRELDLYNKTLTIAFVEFIRPEQTFDGVESLKNQIQIDSQNARQILKNIPALSA